MHIHLVCSIMEDNVGNQTPKHNQNEESTTSTNPIIWFPSVVKDKKPKKGMLFTSLDDAFKFYNSYAKDDGFLYTKKRKPD